jgi:4-aminobutyrate aminotransferase
MTTDFHEACRAHGLLVGKGGLYGNVVRLAPMLNVTAGELDEGITALRAAITDLS